MENHSENVVKAQSEVIGCDVKNNDQENLGKIEEIILHKKKGTVQYVVLSSGGFLGMGGKLFALPWSELNYCPEKECFTVNIGLEKLQNAPGFDKGQWPNKADKSYIESINAYYADLLNYWGKSSLEQLNDLKDKVKDTVNENIEKVKHQMTKSDVCSYMQEKPLQSLLMIAAVGILLKKLIKD